MKHLFVRPARGGDSVQFLDWSRQTAGNLFDPDVAKYPSTMVLAAYDQSGPVLYAPVQQPFFMDALAIKPGSDPLTTALALKEVTHFLITQAHIKGVGEIYFMCNEPTTIEYAKRQGFEEMPWKLLRVKLSNLEGKHE